MMLIVALFFTLETPAFAAINPGNSISPNEFNQWTIRHIDSEFDVSDRIHAENIVNNTILLAANTGITALFGPAVGGVTSFISIFIGEIASECVNNHYDEFDGTGYVRTTIARYGSKLRILVYVYSDSAHNNLVYHDAYSTDHFPI